MEEALRPLSDVPAINRFLSYCRVRTIPGKTVMIHAGDLPDVLYYIVDGSVEVMIEDEDGNEMVLAYLNKGQFFGEMGLFYEQPTRSAWVRTRTESEIAEMTYPRFRQIASESPGLIFELATQLATRLDRTNRKLGDLAFVDVTGRVAHAIMDLCREPDAMTHPDGMQIKVSRQELSRLVGCSREMAGRVLKVLEDQGLVSASGKTIVVFNARRELPKATQRSLAPPRVARLFEAARRLDLPRRPRALRASFAPPSRPLTAASRARRSCPDGTGSSGGDTRSSLPYRSRRRHAEHAIRVVEVRGCVGLARAPLLVGAHERLELRHFGAIDVERARDAPQELPLARVDLPSADGGLQLNLHECARKLAAAGHVRGEQPQALVQRIVESSSPREAVDGFAHLRRATSSCRRMMPRATRISFSDTRPSTFAMQPMTSNAISKNTWLICCVEPERNARLATP